MLISFIPDTSLHVADYFLGFILFFLLISDLFIVIILRGFFQCGNVTPVVAGRPIVANAVASGAVVCLLTTNNIGKEMLPHFLILH